MLFLPDDSEEQVPAVQHNDEIIHKDDCLSDVVAGANGGEDGFANAGVSVLIVDDISA